MVSVDRILEAARNDAARFDKQYSTYAFSNNAENIGWSHEWADGRDAPKGIAYANWNDIGGYGERNQYSERARTLMRRVCDLLERVGVEIEWSDQVDTCDDCGGLIQTSPDSYSWQPDFVIGDGCITCEKCTLNDAENYLESLEGDTGKCVTLDVDPSDYGYELLQGELEHGWHPGQDADPKVIAKDLRARGIERFIFVLEENSQFYSTFAVWVHEDEKDKLGEEPIETDGPSVSAAMEKGLREASAKCDALQGDGIRYASIDADGNATARLISREDFIEKRIKS